MMIREHMASSLVTVEEEMRITEAAELTKKRGFRTFPVMRAEKLVGIVTDGDSRSAADSQTLAGLDLYLTRLYNQNPWMFAVWAVVLTILFGVGLKMLTDGDLSTSASPPSRAVGR